MAISVLINVNENVVQIYDEKNIKSLRKDLVNIFLEVC